VKDISQIFSCVKSRVTLKQLKGKLLIKNYYKRLSANMLRAHIEKCMVLGFAPELIIIDYADKMVPIHKTDTLYRDMGIVYEELRELSAEYKAPIWTASQANRGAFKSEFIEGDELSDALTKGMEADFMISLSRRKEDILKSYVRWYIIKNRFGIDKIDFPGKMDTNTGIIDIYAATSPEAIKIKSKVVNVENEIRQKIKDKFDKFTERIEKLGGFG